jgi:hypothetical protein
VPVDPLGPTLFFAPFPSKAMGTKFVSEATATKPDRDTKLIQILRKRYPDVPINQEAMRKYSLITGAHLSQRSSILVQVLITHVYSHIMLMISMLPLCFALLHPT